jgi:hypothetical protein
VTRDKAGDADNAANLWAPSPVAWDYWQTVRKPLEQAKSSSPGMSEPHLSKYRDTSLEDKTGELLPSSPAAYAESDGSTRTRSSGSLCSLVRSRGACDEASQNPVLRWTTARDPHCFCFSPIEQR